MSVELAVLGFIVFVAVVFVGAFVGAWLWQARTARAGEREDKR